MTQRAPDLAKEQWVSCALQGAHVFSWAAQMRALLCSLGPAWMQNPDMITSQEHAWSFFYLRSAEMEGILLRLGGNETQMCPCIKQVLMQDKFFSLKDQETTFKDRTLTATLGVWVAAAPKLDGNADEPRLLGLLALGA